MVSLLRGAFACPLIQSISELEITERILSSPFALRDFDFLQDSEAVSATLDYLCSLGLIERSESELLQTTEIGRYVLERAGAFGLINSYRDYFADYKSTLKTSRLATKVQRLENVQSTGDLHGRKYFPWAIRSIEPQKPQCLVDLGCGNGNYLSKAISATKSSRVVAVDISPIAVESAIANLSSSDVEIQGVVCSANDVDQWSKAVPNSGDAAVISAWFVLHEFCHGGAEVIREFLERVHRHCPLAELIIGEIIAIPSNLLSKVRETSIYPEVQLFHRLSGQSLLTWHEHQSWIDMVPYTLVESNLHDAINVDGEDIPSTVVWHFVPNR